MMKLFNTILVSVGVLLLAGCTGEKQNTRTAMQEREIILISGSYPQDACMSQELKAALQTQVGLTNALVSSTEPSVNCAYFSRTSTSCVKFSFTEEYPNACVIAVDRMAEKKNGQINGKAVAELMMGLLPK